MRLFGSSRRKPGWMCVNVTQDDRIDVAHVLAADRQRPEVVLCDSYRKEGDNAATLVRMRRELHLNRYRCTTLLRNGSYQMMQVDAPNVPAEEAKDAVRWRIKDMIDYPVEAATIDALFIPAPQNATGHNPQMLAVAARNDLIAATVKPFNDASVSLEVIDVPELAQRNVAHYLEQEGRGLALLAFDEQGGLLTFTCGGELYQFRHIEVSASSFAGADPAQQQDVYDRVVLELQRSLDHFDRQFRHVAIAKVVITPVPGAEGLREYLSANLDVPVVSLDLAQIIDFPNLPELREPARQAQCLQLLGAAMRAEGAV